MPIHDRDGVEEDVERPRPRPQGQQEADREQVEPAPGKDIVDGRHDDLRDGILGEDVAGIVGHCGGEARDGIMADELAHIADRTEDAKDERRQGQQEEEAGFGGQTGHPVAQAHPDRPEHHARSRRRPADPREASP